MGVSVEAQTSACVYFGAVLCFCGICENVNGVSERRRQGKLSWNSRNAQAGPKDKKKKENKESRKDGATTEG